MESGKHKVYILYSAGFDKYYVGVTSDIERRFLDHNAGFNRSTKPYRPWELVLIISKESRSEALKLELKLKDLNKSRIKQFISKYSGLEGTR